MLRKYIVHHRRKNVLRLIIMTDPGKELGRMNTRLQFRQIKAAGFLETSAVNPGMEGRIRRVMTRIVADPAVVVDGGVERLRGIANVVPQYAHDVENVLLRVGDFAGRSVLLISLQAGKTGFQFVEIFHDGPREKADQLPRVVLISGRVNFRKSPGMRGAGAGELRGEIVAEMWKGARVHSVGGEFLQINVMVGAVDMAESHVGDVAPAIRLATEKGNAFAGGRGEREGGEIGGERSQGELINDPMTFVIPGEAGKLSEVEQ